MHKCYCIATATIEGSKLGRQQNKLTPPGCESTEAAVLTVLGAIKVEAAKVDRQFGLKLKNFIIFA